MKKRDTFTSLVLSMLSIVLSMAMLAGTTFAWFTVSVTSGNNIIVSGNLHVELEYSHIGEKDATKWKPVTKDTNLFCDETENGKVQWEWEPGYTRVVYLRVKNTGSMALKFQLGIYTVSEKFGKTSTGTDEEKEIKLSEIIQFGVVEVNEENDFTLLGSPEECRAAAREAVGEAVNISRGFSTEEYRLEKGETSKTIALVIYMPEDCDANPAQDKDQPELNLGIKLIATQLDSEKDSFGSDYDEKADYYPVGSEGRAEYLVSVGYTSVNTDEALANALNEGKNVVLTGDVEVTESVLTAAEGTVIDGNGNKLIGLGTDPEGQGLQLAKNVEYRNIEFELKGGWGVITKSAKFINCTFKAASPYLTPTAGGDIVVDGCIFVNTSLQICYNEGEHIDPATIKTIITNNKFVVNNTDHEAHAMVLAGGSPEFWANGAETVTITGNTFTPNYADTSYIAYYIYGDGSAPLTSVPVYKDNTYEGNANYSMNGTAPENQYLLSRKSGYEYTGREQLPGLTLVEGKSGLYTDASKNFYATTAAGLKAMNEELTKNKDFNQIRGKSYNLLCNIDMKSEEWKSVELTTGNASNTGIIFNGNGYTIHNMNITGGGMFNKTASGKDAVDGKTTIKDLTLDNATVTGGYHVGAIWGQMYGDVVLNNVHVVNSNITGTCNVGGLIGRNGDQGHSTIKFINCSVSNTIVTANGDADPIGASAFLGATLKLTDTSVALTFEGKNTSTNVTLKSFNGTTGGEVYVKSDATNYPDWKVVAVDTFENYDNRGQ